jgi:hypothetical protein
VANETTSLFETLVVPAATNVKLTPKYKNRGLDMCFNGYRSEYGTVGQTMVINVPIVDESNVSDIGSGGIDLKDTDTTPVNITISHKQSSSRRIQSFDRIRTPLDLQTQYLWPMIEEVLRKSNRSVTSLFNPTAFNAYATVAGNAANEMNRATIASAWSNVAGTGAAPVTPADTFFLTDQTVYGNMIGDVSLNFIQQYVSGDAAAVSAQQDAKLVPSMNATLDWDQTMPTSTTGKHGGIYFHRMAVGLLPVLESVPQDSYIRQVTIYPTMDKNFPVTVQFWHSPNDQGHVLHVFSMYGVSVIKKEWGSYCETP